MVLSCLLDDVNHVIKLHQLFLKEVSVEFPV